MSTPTRLSLVSIMEIAVVTDMITAQTDVAINEGMKRLALLNGYSRATALLTLFPKTSPVVVPFLPFPLFPINVEIQPHFAQFCRTVVSIYIYVMACDKRSSTSSNISPSDLSVAVAFTWPKRAELRRGGGH